MGLEYALKSLSKWPSGERADQNATQRLAVCRRSKSSWRKTNLAEEEEEEEAVVAMLVLVLAVVAAVTKPGRSVPTCDGYE